MLGLEAFNNQLSTEFLAQIQTLPESMRQIFTIRLRRNWRDLFQSFDLLYESHPDFQTSKIALFDLLLKAAKNRDPALALIDLERDYYPNWFLSSKMVGYVFYIDRFAGQIANIESRLDYLEELGVTYIHLMPCLKPRDGDSDGGYSVQDYRSINPDFGTIDDLRSLSEKCRDRGMSLCIDLVLNHTAKEHEWAVLAKTGDVAAQNMYYMFDEDTEPKAYEKTLVEIFPEQAPGSFTYYPEFKKTVWTTFNEHQWDLNWSNPKVFLEMLSIIFELANIGVDVFRLDAVAFMWKRMGTNCQNLPEVHDIIQAIRSATKIVAPGILLKAEAIVSPENLAPYLGTGCHAGKVSNLAYHNNLMVQFWNSIATKDTKLMRHILHNHFPAKFENACFATYLRCHDDIGWAITDEDTAVIGANAAMHRDYLADFYKGDFEGSFARGGFFQYNPKTNDKRSNGTLASLLGLEAAIKSDDPIRIDLSIHRILLGHSLIASFGGVPLLYMGDEYGALNDYDWQEARGGTDDSRWIHRPVFNQAAARLRNDLSTTEGQIFQGIAKIMNRRGELQVLDAVNPTEILFPEAQNIFAFKRSSASEELIGLFNFSDEITPMPSSIASVLGVKPIDLLTNTPMDVQSLQPYAHHWFAITK